MSTEARVGVLVLVAAVLLGGFVFALSGVRLKSGYDLFVDFNNPGSVQSGAPVKIAGIKVGSVKEVEYRGGRLDTRTHRRALVRVRLRVDEDVKKTIHEDALFFVTTQGVLGEQFVAIDPGSPDKPVLPPGSVAMGVDPPRLDLALALGYELLETLTSAIRDNRPLIKSMLDDIGLLLREMAGLLRDHGGEIGRIIANIETATQEANQLLASVRTQYVDSPQTRRILGNIDRILATTSRDLDPLMRDIRSIASNANETLATIGPQQREELKTTIASAARLADRANETLGDAQQIVRHVREGRGTIGAFVMDEEVYDDVQELLRDLKHNPWKFFWRE